MSTVQQILEVLRAMSGNKTEDFNGKKETVSSEMLSRLPATANSKTQYSVTRQLVAMQHRSLFRRTDLLFTVEATRTFATFSFEMKTNFRGCDFAMKHIMERLDEPTSPFNSIKVQEVEAAFIDKYIDQFVTSLIDAPVGLLDQFLTRMTKVSIIGYGDTQWTASTKELNTTVDRNSLKSAIADLINDSVAEMARDDAFVRKLKVAESKWLQFAADEYTKRAEEERLRKEKEEAEAAAAKATTAAETKAPADGVKMEEN